MKDVIVVGGGAAGLSAALLLGRSRRHTVVVDAGAPRNAPSPEAHSCFTRDGTPPSELLRIARAQLAPYTTVELRADRVVSATREDDAFVVHLASGGELRARRLVLALGVRDLLPAIEGLAELWGRGVLHCPYCHGWEVRDAPLALYASGPTAMEMAPLLLQWSRDLLLCTGGGELAAEDRSTLIRDGVRIVDTPVLRLEGSAELDRIVFADGHVEARRALFLRPDQVVVAGELVEQLGCERTDAGFVHVGADQKTSVPGVYAAGDMTTPLQQIVVAAASGAQAAMHLNRELVQVDHHDRLRRASAIDELQPG